MTSKVEVEYSMSDEVIKRNIAAHVARLRGSRSRSWLAGETGTYAINITRIESAEHMPGGGLLLRLAAALGVTTDYLLSEPEPESKNKSRKIANARLTSA